MNYLNYNQRMTTTLLFSALLFCGSSYIAAKELKAPLLHSSPTVHSSSTNTQTTLTQPTGIKRRHIDKDAQSALAHSDQKPHALSQSIEKKESDGLKQMTELQKSQFSMIKMPDFSY